MNEALTRKQYVDGLTIVQNLIGDLNHLVELPTISDDFSPILHTPLTAHSGIAISGKFKTDDTNATLSYVTVLRQSTTSSAYDGLGFAWSIGDGTKYNVYLTDNNALTSDIFIGQDFIFQNTGENSFLAAAQGEIVADTQYSFKLNIGVNYSLDLYIWPTADGEFNLSNPNLITVSHGSFTPRSDGDHFGIGVVNTKGKVWYYDDLKIESISSLHTAVLYRLHADPAKYTIGSDTTIKFYGYGFDGTTYGLNMYLWNVNGGEWELAGSNTATNVTPTANTLISSTFQMSTDYRDADNMVNICVTTPETSSNTASNVTTHYVSLENTLPSGIHIGGKADVYVYEPSNIILATQQYSHTTGAINLSTLNGFASPVISVARVLTTTDGEELVENQDWSLYTSNTGLAYSTREAPYLSISPDFANRDLTIIYRYYGNGVDLQTLLDSPKYRFVGTDNVGKFMPLVYIKINNLEYSGTLTITKAQELIQDYVINTSRVIVSEIIALLMANGATYVNTANIDVTAQEYDHTRALVAETTITTSYSLPSFRGFYADIYTLDGLVKL